MNKSMKNHNSALELALAGLQEKGHNKDFNVSCVLTDANGQKLNYTGKTAIADSENSHFSTAVQIGTVRDGKFSVPSELAGMKKSQSTSADGTQLQLSFTRAINAIVQREVVRESDLPTVPFSPERDEQEQENKDLSRGGLVDVLARLEPTARAAALRTLLAKTEEEMLEKEIEQEQANSGN